MLGETFDEDGAEDFGRQYSTRSTAVCDVCFKEALMGDDPEEGLLSGHQQRELRLCLGENSLLESRGDYLRVIMRGGTN